MLWFIVCLLCIWDCAEYFTCIFTWFLESFLLNHNQNVTVLGIYNLNTHFLSKWLNHKQSLFHLQVIYFYLAEQFAENCCCKNYAWSSSLPAKHRVWLEVTSENSGQPASTPLKQNTWSVRGYHFPRKKKANQEASGKVTKNMEQIYVEKKDSKMLKK